MKRKKEHISMMKAANVDGGYVQCVIAIGLKGAFEDLGFVDHADKLLPADEPFPRVSFETGSDNDTDLKIDLNIDPLTLKPYADEKETKPKKKKAATANKT